MKEHLSVSEKFYSIQGEGRTTGIPAVFLRLSGCNLLCQSSSWICDTIEVWKKGKRTDFDDVLEPEWVEHLRNGAHLVFTGGEPLLHQKAIIDYLSWFRGRYKFKPKVEVETNGTVSPEPMLLPSVNYWNVSPKLSNSGEPFERRFNDVAIKALNSSPLTMFKFVIENEEDVLEMINEYGKHIDMKKVVLMPAGENQEQLNKTRLTVVEQCMKLGLRYSDRQHIVIWNQKTGV